MSDLGPPETSSLDELLLVLYIEIEASIDLKILTSKKIDGPKCLRFPAQCVVAWLVMSRRLNKIITVLGLLDALHYTLHHP